MFGLSDNKTQQTDLPGMNPPGHMPPDNNYPAGNPLAHLPDSPPVVDTNHDPMGLSTPATPSPAPNTDTPSNSSSMQGVNLDNAYIANDPPAVASGDDTKPTASSLVGGGDNDELLQMKHQALQTLAPLMGKLEQSPEEKFKTMMMMIQASDNAELIKEAYEAANSITDEKARAQALLDIVNEINYFTNPQAGSGEQTPKP